MKHRFAVLDAWRGIAALSVALYHFQMNSRVLETFVVKNASMFVDFFFVLSGFVLAHAYTDRLRGNLSFWDYAIRRIGRLWPLHVAVIGYLVYFEFYTSGLIDRGLLSSRPLFSIENGRDMKLLLENLFFVHALGFERRLGWNTPSWTISAEFWVCILFALIWTTAKTKKSGIWITSALLISSYCIVGLFSKSYLGSSLAFALPKCMVGFFTGNLVYWWRQRSARTDIPFGTLLELGSIAVVLWFLWVVPPEREKYDPLTMLAPFVFSAVVWIFSFEQGLVSRFLSLRPLVWLGTISYSIYMVHDPIASQLGAYVRGCVVDPTILGCDGDFGWIDRAFQQTLPFGDLVVATYALFVVLMASATYILIEDPGRKIFNAVASALGRKKSDSVSVERPSFVGK